MDFGADDKIGIPPNTSLGANWPRSNAWLETIKRGTGAPDNGARYGRKRRMAMTMSGEATLPAARPKVWAMLNDADVLKACIPGCQSLEKAGD